MARNTKKQLTTPEWREKTTSSIKHSLTKSWARIDKALTGELLTTKEVARRIVDDIEAQIREDIVPRIYGNDAPEFKFLVKEKNKLAREIIEAYQLCQISSAEVQLFKTLAQKVLPDLQQVEQNIKSEHNHVVFLPQRAQSSEAWAKTIEGEARSLPDKSSEGQIEVLTEREAQKA